MRTAIYTFLFAAILCIAVLYFHGCPVSGDVKMKIVRTQLRSAAKTLQSIEEDKEIEERVDAAIEALRPLPED